jgi:hypothetical protein
VLTAAEGGAARWASLLGAPRPGIALGHPHRDAGGRRGRDAGYGRRDSLRLRQGSGRALVQAGVRAHLGQQRAAPGVEVQPGQMLQDRADADALVGDPVDRVVAVALAPGPAVLPQDAALVVLPRDAAVVQGHDLPLVVEDGGARVTGAGVGPVVDEVVEPYQHRVVAQDDLLEAPVRVTDDVHLLAEHQLAELHAEPVPAEDLTRRTAVQGGRDRHQGEVQPPVRGEEGPRVELHAHGGVGNVVDRHLGVELREAPAGEALVGQHVVVGHQQPRRDQEAGAVRQLAAAAAQGDPGHRGSGPDPARQEAPGLELVRQVDDAFVGVGEVHRLAVDVRHHRRGRQATPVEDPLGTHGERVRVVREPHTGRHPALDPLALRGGVLVPLRGLGHGLLVQFLVRPAGHGHLVHRLVLAVTVPLSQYAPHQGGPQQRSPRTAYAGRGLEVWESGARYEAVVPAGRIQRRCPVAAAC